MTVAMSFLLTTLLLLLLPSPVISVASSRCRADDDALLADEVVRDSFRGLTDQFNRTCDADTNGDCSFTVEPIDLTLVRDYTSFGALEDACSSAHEGHVACRATTRAPLSLFDDLELRPGVRARAWIEERGRPTCVPPQCDIARDAEMVYPTPPGTVERRMVCPADRPRAGGDDGASCAEAMLRPTTDFSARRAVFDDVVAADCERAVRAEGHTGACTFSVGDVRSESRHDLGGAFRDDPYYQMYVLACQRDAGGRVCTADVDVHLVLSAAQTADLVDESPALGDVRVTLSSFGRATVRATLRGLPQCLAPSCADDVADVEDRYARRLEAFAAERWRLPVRCDTAETCDVTLTRVSCDDERSFLTRAPSPAAADGANDERRGDDADADGDAKGGDGAPDGDAPANASAAATTIRRTAWTAIASLCLATFLVG